jgi:hypothetical protein
MEEALSYRDFRSLPPVLFRLALTAGVAGFFILSQSRVRPEV